MQAGVIQGVGSILSGFSEYRTANAEADELRIGAGEQLAAGQRGAAVSERQTQLVLSRQRAVAGASGAGATDPTVQDIESETSRAGEYDALTKLYNGESAARSMRYQAAMTSYAGTNALSAGLIGGAGKINDSTISSTGQTLLQKYGGNLPSWMGGADTSAPGLYGPPFD